MSEGNLKIDVQRDGRSCRIHLAGEIDMSSAPLLRKTLLEVIEVPFDKLLIDLSQVGYIDSSGVGTIVELRRRIDRSGGDLLLAGLQDRVRSVFEITKLDKFFTIVDDAESA